MREGVEQEQLDRGKNIEWHTGCRQCALVSTKNSPKQSYKINIYLFIEVTIKTYRTKQIKA